MMEAEATRRYDAVLFDLLTALIDSWSLWNEVAGSAETGLRWRRRYLALTYQAGAYVPYEDLVARAAGETRLAAADAEALRAAGASSRPGPKRMRSLPRWRNACRSASSPIARGASG